MACDIARITHGGESVFWLFIALRPKRVRKSRRNRAQNRDRLESKRVDANGRSVVASLVRVSATSKMEAAYSVMKSFERKVSLETKHWLLRLLGATLQRPAIGKRLETVKKTSLVSDSLQTVAFNEASVHISITSIELKYGIIREVLGENNFIENFSHLTRQGDPYSVGRRVGEHGAWRRVDFPVD